MFGLFLVNAQMSDAQTPVTRVMRACEQILPHELLTTKIIPKCLKISKKPNRPDSAEARIQDVNDDDIMNDIISDWYFEHGIDQFTVHPLSLVSDVVYRHTYPNLGFHAQPLILNGLYHIGIKRDIFNAILFAIDHGAPSLTIHILSKNASIRSRCDKMITDFVKLRWHIIVPSGGYCENIDDIIDYFGISDKPYIPYTFCCWLINVRLNVIDVEYTDGKTEVI